MAAASVPNKEPNGESPRRAEPQEPVGSGGKRGLAAETSRRLGPETWFCPGCHVWSIRHPGALPSDCYCCSPGLGWNIPLWSPSISLPQVSHLYPIPSTREEHSLLPCPASLFASAPPPPSLSIAHTPRLPKGCRPTPPQLHHPAERLIWGRVGLSGRFW